MSAGEIKGVVTRQDIPAALKAYVDASLQSVFNKNSRLKAAASPYRVAYNKVMLSSLTDVRRTVTRNAKKFGHPQWRLDNSTTYVDALGVPYRKDGTILVVIADKHESRTVGPAGNISIKTHTLGSPAEFDSKFNRIVVTPIFAELLRENRVRTLGAENSLVNVIKSPLNPYRASFNNDDAAIDAFSASYAGPGNRTNASMIAAV